MEDDFLVLNIREYIKNGKSWRRHAQAGFLQF